MKILYPQPIKIPILEPSASDMIRVYKGDGASVYQSYCVLFKDDGIFLKCDSDAASELDPFSRSSIDQAEVENTLKRLNGFTLEEVGQGINNDLFRGTTISTLITRNENITVEKDITHKKSGILKSNLLMRAHLLDYSEGIHFNLRSIYRRLFIYDGGLYIRIKHPFFRIKNNHLLLQSLKTDCGVNDKKFYSDIFLNAVGHGAIDIERASAEIKNGDIQIPKPLLQIYLDVIRKFERNSNSINLNLIVYYNAIISLGGRLLKINGSSDDDYIEAKAQFRRLISSIDDPTLPTSQLNIILSKIKFHISSLGGDAWVGDGDSIAIYIIYQNGDKFFPVLNTIMEEVDEVLNTAVNLAQPHSESC